MNRKSINNWAMLLVAALLMMTVATACKQNKNASQDEVTQEEPEAMAEVTQEEMEALAEVLPKYSLFSSFQEGLAAVCDKKTDLWGFIDKSGNEVIPCKFDYVRFGFSDGVAIVEVEDGQFIIDRKGKKIAPIGLGYHNGFHEGLLGLISTSDEDGEKQGFLDKTGRMVIPATFDAVMTECSTPAFFNEGLAHLYDYESGKSIVIDKKGKTVFECDGRIQDFHEGLAAVWRNTSDREDEYEFRYGFVDKNGDEAIPFIFNRVGDFSDGLCWAETDDKCGFINHNGEFVLTDDYQTIVLYEDYECEEFELCPSFSEGLAWVCNKDGKFGYIDKKGKVVIPFRYKPGYDDEAELYDEQPCFDFHGGLARIWDNKTRLFGFIDRKGKEVFPCQFETAEDVSEGVALISRDGEYGFIDAKGNCTLDLGEL